MGLPGVIDVERRFFFAAGIYRNRHSLLQNLDLRERIAGLHSDIQIFTIIGSGVCYHRFCIVVGVWRGPVGAISVYFYGRSLPGARHNRNRSAMFGAATREQQ